jgi:hypothetical protein
MARVFQQTAREEVAMNKLIFTCIAAALVTAPMATLVKAEETTVIKLARIMQRFELRAACGAVFG